MAKYRVNSVETDVAVASQHRHHLLGKVGALGVALCAGNVEQPLLVVAELHDGVHAYCVHSVVVPLELLLLRIVAIEEQNKPKSRGCPPKCGSRPVKCHTSKRHTPRWEKPRLSSSEHLQADLPQTSSHLDYHRQI